jgi:hypothetical protein
VPTNLRITATAEDSISLAWSASTDSSGSVQHYVTCYSGFCGSNVLRWDASTDDVDAQSAIEYEIYLNGSLFTVGAPGVASAFLQTPAGTNTWTVVAVDPAGNSSGASNAATLTVQADSNLC